MNRGIYLELYEISKKKHQTLISQLKNMIDDCEDMENILTQVLPGASPTEERELLSLNVLKKVYMSDQLHLERKLKTIQTVIHDNCSHRFVYDLIDTTPDTSKYIKYCELCETTANVIQ